MKALLISTLLYAICIPSAFAGLLSSNTLNFSTTDKTLAENTKESVKKFTIYQASHSRNFGEIQSVTLDTVPLSRLQSEWENAVSSCDNKSYGGISPTRAQCISGAKIKYPSGTKYCWGVPCGIKYSTVNITGIGDKPTQAVTGTFDVGAAVSVNSNTEISLNFTETESAGTVNASYGADTTIEINQSATDPDVYTISSTVNHKADATSLTSQANEQSSRVLDFELVQTGNVSLKGCVPPNPCQEENIEFGLNSVGLPETLSQQVLALSSSDSQGGILPDYQITLGDDVEFSFGAEDLESAGLPVDKIEYEFKAPTMVAATFPLPITGGLPVGEIGLYNAGLEMATSEGCHFNNAGVKSCLNTTSIDPTTGAITRTIAPGDRTDLSSGVLTSPVQDTDYLQIGFDLDYWLNGGVGFGVAGGIPLLLTANVDLIDLDLSLFFGKKQELFFEPNLMATYQFSIPTLVEINGEFKLVSEITVDPNTVFNIKHPDPNLIITPVYSIKDNTFINTSWDYIDVALVEKVLAVGISGAMFDAIPELDIRGDYGALQATVGFGESEFKTNYLEEGKLEGFDDIQGQQIRFASLIPDIDDKQQVPEPKSLFMLLMGLALLLTIRSTGKDY